MTCPFSHNFRKVQNSQTRQLQVLLDTYMYSSASVLAKTVKVHKIYSYNDFWKLAKPNFFLLLIQLNWPTTKVCTSTLLGFYMKQLLSVVCVMFDFPNFIQNCISRSFLICRKPFSVHLHSMFHRKVGLKRV